MPTTVLHLEFDPPIRGDERVDLFVHALKENFPGILWANGTNITPTEKNINSHKTLVVMMDYNNSSPYSLLFSEHSVRPNELAHVLNIEPIPVTDGWKWIEEKSVDYDETSGLFDSINESLLVENYQPRLNLYFDPMIESYDELESILDVLTSVEPDLRWYGGNKIKTYNPFRYIDDDDDTRGITFLTIGYFSDHPDRLTYTTGLQEPENYPYVDGYEWVERQRVNYDDTSELFNQLNESLEDGESIAYEFDDRLNEKEWSDVVNSLKVLYPGIRWASDDEIDDYKNIGIFGLRVRKKFGGGYELRCSDHYNWYRSHGYSNIHDGTQLLGDYDETSSLFDSLNESSEITKMPEGAFVIKFDPPVNSKDWYRVASLIDAVYPGLTWRRLGGTGRSSLQDYNPMVYDGELLSYLFIGEPKPTRRIMWDNEENPPSEDDGPIIDGWELIGTNDTHDMFDQLDEQALREESLDKKVTYLIEKDINIEWDAMVKILKEYFGDNVSWNGRGDISKLPSVGNNWQTLAIKYDNFYNRFLVNFGRDKPQRYFELYPKHELIKLSEVSTDIDNTSNLFNQLNESTGNGINKYKVGDKFYCKEDLHFDRSGEKFVTEGNVYEIVRIDSDYDWEEYGYRGNRYILLTNNKTYEDANHGFSDGYLDRNFIPIPKGSDIDIDFDQLYESEEDDLGWAQEITSNVPNRVSHNNLYFGMKVLPGGPHWDWGTQGQDAEYGTIEPYPEGDNEGELFKLEDEDDYGPMGGYWVQVIWRDKDGSYLDENNYRVGPKYFDLKYYFEDTNLNEGYWDDLYKSKRYTQKFGIGDRVIMNGSVGGKTLTNELGTVLKFKNTGGGTGHPHRVYLILFDNWSDTKMNFLMSSVQADQNRDFTDHRCGEGRCWYSTSDYLEPAPDSNEMFDTLNESEDLDWTNDIVDSNSNFEPQGGEWVVVDTGQHYPWNPDMWQYFEIPGFNECLEGETSYGMVNANRECIDDLYARGILVHPRRDDICYVNKKVWTKVTTFSKKLPVYHCIRKSDGGHFLVTSKGVEPFSSQ
jgi:hypothetical protein